jgi:hypothetical protein
MAVDHNFHVWVASNGPCGLVEIDGKTRTLVAQHQLAQCSTPIGVSVDVDGFVWLVDQEGWAWKIDTDNPAGMQMIVVPGSHYVYSDMTGGQLKSVSPPAGLSCARISGPFTRSITRPPARREAHQPDPQLRGRERREDAADVGTFAEHRRRRAIAGQRRDGVEIHRLGAHAPAHRVQRDRRPLEILALLGLGDPRGRGLGRREVREQPRGVVPHLEADGVHANIGHGPVYSTPGGHDDRLHRLTAAAPRHERQDDAAFARRLADPGARLLALDGLDPVVDAGGLTWRDDRGPRPGGRAGAARPPRGPPDVRRAHAGGPRQADVQRCCACSPTCPSPTPRPGARRAAWSTGTRATASAAAARPPPRSRARAGAGAARSAAPSITRAPTRS